MKKNVILYLFLTILTVISAACSQTTSKESDTKSSGSDTITVSTTIYPLQDFTEKIGGEYVKVNSIVPSGVEAHSYEPTTKTVIKVAESDAFIYMGTGIEGFTEKVIKSVENEKVAVVKASEGVELITSGAQAEMEAGDEEHTGEGEMEHQDVDPHVWLDPKRSIQLAENIKDALGKIKPEQEQYFQENYNELKKELEELDTSFKEMVNKSPKKTIVVAHSAYGYWENAYGIQQIGVSGLSPTDEPSQKELTEVIELAQKMDIRYILFEQNVNSKVAEVIKREIGAETLTLHNLESLTENDLKNNEDYSSIMKNNIETVRKALQ